ncbi:B3/4 domain-containing protein [Lysinibacillus odysseyi]|uniref:tRNA synthetase subunit beta n=1 Tax=Lysinibacillus odysseyi 34hs-1 = NBRC 100172 TaxID=1220589 RepID=A0A0A3IDW9_9BACI|nr:phenylalanine--tRNA ligase beta subunit-related protein [Lysinibacillus odysseyi]KGR82914.1 tRNA synthetase subunit beta [Lysinibacillus odysseyi 34hs-1 = NBRC 100172]
MNISLDTSLLEKVPAMKIGLIHYTKITVSDSPQMIKGRIQLYQENLFFELQDTPVTERPGIQEWRSLWKAFGADPNRYRHSAESLLRRIAKQQYLVPFHSAVDINNFFSLQYEVPIGIYDTVHLEGDITIALGTENTSYDGLNGRSISLKNIPHSKDAIGPFGSPYVDSIRTAVSENTTDALHIFYLRPSIEEAEARQLLTSSGKMFTQVNGGDFELAVLSAAEPTTSL